jgi:putative transposase
MEWQPTRWTAAQLEERRVAAARLLRAGGATQAAIARRLGVSRAAVTQWKRRLEARGLRGVQRRAPTGRPSRLSPPQWGQLLRVLRRGAVAAGFETERWTLPRIAAAVRRTFGVRYHPHSLGPALRARGWSPQVPIARARERDEALIRAWLQHDWPRIKRGLADPGGPSSSSTRRGTPSSPGWAPPGPRSAGPRSCGA